jgi:hypothetical protein
VAAALGVTVAYTRKAISMLYKAGHKEGTITIDKLNAQIQNARAARAIRNQDLPF